MMEGKDNTSYTSYAISKHNHGHACKCPACMAGRKKFPELWGMRSCAAVEAELETALAEVEQLTKALEQWREWGKE